MTYGDEEINGSQLKCDFHFVEFYKPLEWAKSDEQSTCAYMGIGLTKSCVGETKLNINNYAVLVLSARLTGVNAVAYLGFHRIKLQQIRDDSYRKARGGTGDKRKADGTFTEGSRSKLIFHPAYYIGNDKCDQTQNKMFIDTKGRMTDNKHQTSRWVMESNINTDAGSALVFVLVDMSKNGNRVQMQSLVKTKYLKDNAVSKELLKGIYESLTDVVVLSTSDEIVADNEWIQTLFMKEIPFLELSEEVENGRKAMSRCFITPNDVEQQKEEAELLVQITSLYRIPLWSLTEPLFERNVARCLVSDAVVSLHMDENTMMDKMFRTFKLDQSQMDNFQLVYHPYRFHNTNSNNGDVVLENERDITNEEQSNHLTSNECSVTMDVLRKEFSEHADLHSKQLNELREHLDAVLSNMKMSASGLEVVRSYGLRKRGIMSSNEYGTFRKLCISYFRDINNVKTRCEELVQSYGYTVEVFVHEDNIHFSKLRSSVDTVGQGMPIMNCKQFDPKWNQQKSEKSAKPYSYRAHEQSHDGFGEHMYVVNDDYSDHEYHNHNEHEERYEENERENPHNLDVWNDSRERERNAEPAYIERGYEREDVFHSDSDEERFRPRVKRHNRLRENVFDEDDDAYEEDEIDEEERMIDELDEEENNVHMTTNGGISTNPTFQSHWEKIKRMSVPFAQSNDELLENEEELLNPLNTRINNKQGLCITRYEPSNRGFRNFQATLRRLKQSSDHKWLVKTAHKEVDASVALFDYGEDEYTLTAKYTTNVLQALKSGMSANAMQRVLVLNQVNGAYVGSNHYSRRSFNLIADAISKELHLDVINFIDSTEYGFSLLVDGSEDAAQIGVVVFQVRVLIDDWPTVLHWELLEKFGDSSVDYMKLLIDSIENAVNLLKQPPPKVFMRTFASKLISCTSDGASNMKKLWSYIDQLKMDAPPPTPSFPHVWCRSHFMETVIKRLKDEDGTVRLAIAIIRSVHVLFNTNQYSKTRRVWRHTSELINGKEYSFGSYHQVRWSPSVQKLLYRIMHQYGTLLTMMKKDLLETPVVKLKLSVRNQILSLYHVMSDVRVYLRLNALLNVITAFTEASLSLQKESVLIADAEFIINSTFSSMTYFFKPLMDHNLFNNDHSRFFGFMCKNMTSGLKDFCPERFVDHLFESNLPSPTFHDLRPILLLTLDQVTHGSDDYLNSSFPDHILADFRLLEDGPDYIWNDEIANCFRILETDTQPMSSKDFENILNGFWSKDVAGEQLDKVPVMRLYQRLEFLDNVDFKTSMIGNLRRFIKFQYEKYDEPLRYQNYYATSVDVLADALNCSHVMNPILSSTCLWARTNDVGFVRHYPFYMSGEFSFNFELRKEAILHSVRYYSDKLGYPNLLHAYYQFITSIHYTITSIPLHSITDPVLKLIRSGSVEQLRKINGPSIIQSLVRNKNVLGLSADIVHLLRMSMIPSATSSSVERAFSHLNSFKSPSSTRMTVMMENARMRSIMVAPSINLYDPNRATHRFLHHSSRNVSPVTHDHRKNAVTAIRKELTLSYYEKSVILNPASSDLSYVDHTTPAYHFVQNEWAQRGMALKSLQNHKRRAI